MGSTPSQGAAIWARPTCKTWKPLTKQALSSLNLTCTLSWKPFRSPHSKQRERCAQLVRHHTRPLWTGSKAASWMITHSCAPQFSTSEVCIRNTRGHTIRVYESSLIRGTSGTSSVVGCRSAWTGDAGPRVTVARSPEGRPSIHEMQVSFSFRFLWRKLLFLRMRHEEIASCASVSDNTR